MKRPWPASLSVTLGLLLLAGCGGSNGETPVITKTPTGEPVKPTEPVTVQLSSWDETQQIVAKNPGKVVVIDLWTTY